MTNFYCITLPSTPERTEHARLQFEREGVSVTWVYGVDAVKFAIKPHLYMHSNPDGSKYFISPGACALVLSHYMALRFAERDGGDFVIFEDDIVLPENFLSEFEEVKKQTPEDCLGVWLEYCCVEPERMEKISDRLRRALPLCTAAVWYRPEAIPHLLDAIAPAHAPVDILIKERAALALKPCVTYPQLCKQATYAGEMSSLIQGSTLHGTLPTEPPGEIA